MKIRAIINVGSLIALLLIFASFAYGGEFKRTVMQVSDMQCGSCLRVIDAELRKIPGIAGMTANFRKGQVVVDHETEVSAEEISGLISGLGYPTATISTDVLPAGSLKRFERSGFGSGPGCCNPGGESPVAESWKELRRRFFKGRGRGRDGSRQAPEGSE